jgi:hypothetical protein
MFGAMSDVHRLFIDADRRGQLDLGLVVELDPASALSELRVGDRFVLESGSLEGRVEGFGTGSATVLLWRHEATRPERTTWALTTTVRRFRA